MEFTPIRISRNNIEYLEDDDSMWSFKNVRLGDFVGNSHGWLCGPYLYRLGVF